MRHTKNWYKIWVLEALGPNGEDQYRIYDNPTDLLKALRWLRSKGFMTFVWRM